VIFKFGWIRTFAHALVTSLSSENVNVSSTSVCTMDFVKEAMMDLTISTVNFDIVYVNDTITSTNISAVN